MPVDLIIHGAGGRMGREIARLALADEQVRLAGCLEARGHAALGQDMGTLCGHGACGIALTDDAAALPLQTSVIIDFSAPAAATALLARVHAGRGAVVGTTGFSPAEQRTVEEASRHMPLLLSPNMSLGVNLLFHLTEEVARRLGPSYDVEIVEAHHRDKKDAPSGTARRLGELAAAALGLAYESDTRHGRAGMVGARSRREIGMHAVRGGDIVGDHTVLFAGDGERLELRHMAHSRVTFARGALTAARWLSGRAPGLYSMRDVLGL